MNDITTNHNYQLTNLGRVNIILGKNGSGKSTLLRDIDHPDTKTKNPTLGKIKYITPERGGTLVYAPEVETNISSNTDWLGNSRRKNQEPSFKQQTVAQYRTLETLVLREIEKNEDPKVSIHLTNT